MNAWISLIYLILGLLLGGVVTYVVTRHFSERTRRELERVTLHRRIFSLDGEFFLAKKLADEILAKPFKPEVIVAIVPGGAMVGEWLSRVLLGTWENPIPLLTVWAETQRSGTAAMSTETTVKPELSCQKKQLEGFTRVLIVNDISRGGETLKKSRAYVEKLVPTGDIRSATLLVHKISREVPSFYVDETDQDVRFIWKDGLI